MSLHVPAGPAPRTDPAAALDPRRWEGAACIPEGLTVQGTAQYPCDVAVQGKVDGTLRSESIALIAPGAAVHGRIIAGDAFVQGTVAGEIDCSNGAVEFAHTAQCKAVVRYRELSVARGAEVEADLQQVGVRRG